MPLQIDAFNKLILITSPTVSVDMQVLHDFIEDYMASPIGMATDGANDSFKGDIIKPEGKIEDPTNPGIFSQIIVLLNPEWQVQFFAGSGYTRIFGGKLVGGVGDEPFKATGAAGDITVLESPVDGLTVVSGSGVTEQDKLDISDRVWDETLSEHTSAGSTGEALDNVSAGASPSTIADAVWNHVKALTFNLWYGNK